METALNWDQIYALIRNVLLALGAGLVAKGYLSADTLSAIVGGVVGVVSVILSQIFHSDQGQSLVPSKAPAAAEAGVSAPPARTL
jgi:hypothetical protein